MEENEREILDIKKVNIDKILKYKYNKADLFDEDEQKKIAKLVIETYDADKLSRSTRETRWNEIKAILNETKVVQKTSERRANVIYPLIKQACKKWATEAYPLLFQNSEVVKAKIFGRDDGQEAIDEASGQPLTDKQGVKLWSVAPGQKVDKADRRVEFDNFVFMKKIENYEKNTDEMLFRLPAYGTYFKKLYYSKDKKIIKADILFPQNVIVNNFAVDNEYTIYSQELQLDVNDIDAKQKTGIFLDIDLKPDFIEEEKTPISDTEDTVEHSNYTEARQLFIEQHRWLDLDDDGFMEPYIVVVHKESEKLLGIYARYTKDDITKNGKDIVYIKPRQFFIKYGFIPTNDGSFYDEGFGDLLFHTNNVVDTLINQLVDAGTLANSSQGFISKAMKKRPGDVSVKPGTWEYIDMMGVNLRDAILPIDHKEPSIVLFQLLEFILNASKELVGNNPAFSQDMNPNLAPTTMMALVEEGAKEFKALYKRVYRSLGKEIALVEEIIKENKEVFQPLYKKVLDDEKANFDEDYDNESYDIIPVSDIEVVTSFEKKQKAMFLLQLTGNQILLPYLNIELILKNVLLSTNCKDISNIIQTPPPVQTDPKIEIEQMKLQLKEGELQIKQQQIQAETAVKAEKEKNELLRIQIAGKDQMIKQADGMLKAKEMDYTLAEKEATIESIVAGAILKYAQANKANAEAGQDTKETEEDVEKLYEPK